MTVTPAQDQAKSATAAAKTIINSLQLALKMFTLYAEDHVYCERSIARLHDRHGVGERGAHPAALLSLLKSPTTPCGRNRVVRINSRPST